MPGLRLHRIRRLPRGVLVGRGRSLQLVCRGGVMKESGIGNQGSGARKRPAKLSARWSSGMVDRIVAYRRRGRSVAEIVRSGHLSENTVLRVLAAVASRLEAGAPSHRVRHVEAAPPARDEALAPPSGPVVARSDGGFALRVFGAARSCQFIVGEVGPGKDWRYCGGEIARGPYCQEHWDACHMTRAA